MAVSRNDEVGIEASHEPTFPKEKTKKNIFVTIEEVLNRAQRHSQESAPKQEVLEELESMVAGTKTRYEEAFKDYKNAIKTYEKLSADFDAKIRQESDRIILASLDRSLQAQAQEVIKLKEKSNSAYLELMSSYDAAVPILLEKHF